MDRPFVSLIASAIRNDRYEITLESLSKECDVSFEVIFVGDKPPKKKMPDNFKYVYTKVKPSQCIEIAARLAQGLYLMPISDDLIFSEGFLNKMYVCTRRTQGRKMLFSSRYSESGEMRDNWLFYNNDDRSPVIGSLCCLYPREIWRELGGLDNRFIALHAETDMKMRFFEIGYTIFIIPNCVVNEEWNGADLSLSQKTLDIDRDMLDYLWTKECGTILSQRNFSVQSFVDNDILKTSQGKNIKFRWR